MTSHIGVPIAWIHEKGIEHLNVPQRVKGRFIKADAEDTTKVMHRVVRRQLIFRPRNTQDEGLNDSFDRNAEQILQGPQRNRRMKHYAVVYADNKTWEAYGSMFREQQDWPNSRFISTEAEATYQNGRSKKLFVKVDGEDRIRKALGTKIYCDKTSHQPWDRTGYCKDEHRKEDAKPA